MSRSGPCRRDAAWEAQREGVLLAIKQAAKNGDPVEQLKQDLTQVEAAKPAPVRVPQLLRGDDTPENLAWAISHEWPSGGVLVSEAGSVFGSHGMGKESIMRSLALLNILWDGGEHRVGRRSSESFTVRGARLTMALQIQEATLRAFFDRSDGLARRTGFLARFLVAWPESTQGHRHFTEPPSTCTPRLWSAAIRDPKTAGSHAAHLRRTRPDVVPANGSNRRQPRDSFSLWNVLSLAVLCCRHFAHSAS